MPRAPKLRVKLLAGHPVPRSDGVAGSPISFLVESRRHGLAWRTALRSLC
jgi:hypothetical protein